MTCYIILDRVHGGLQYSGAFADADAAFAAFVADVGGDFDRDAYRIEEVTPEEMAAVEAWWNAGADASEYPLA